MPVPSDFDCEYVYFFGTFEHVASIFRYGQYSREMITKYEKKDILTWVDSALKQNIINKRRQYSAYVSLYFGTHTPTQDRVEQGKDFAFIKYRADDVFQIEDSKFSNYALQEVHHFGNGGLWDCKTASQNLAKLNWPILHRKIKERWHVWGNQYGQGPAKQSELLIKDHLSHEYIKEIVVFSENSVVEFQKVFLKSSQESPSLFVDYPINPISNPTITVDQTLFFRAHCNLCGDGDDVTWGSVGGGYCNNCYHTLKPNGDCMSPSICKTCKEEGN